MELVFEAHDAAKSDSAAGVSPVDQNRFVHAITWHNFEQARRELFSEGCCSALSESGLSDARHQ
jgi:hypothetical protein